MSSRRLKVVIDTNILVSSLWGGKPGRIIELWDEGKLSLIASEEILSEYFSVIERFDITDEDMEDLAVLFANPHKAVIVELRAKVNIVKKDPADNKFLEAAIAGHADFIVSGDTHLLEVKKSVNIPIVTPAEFLNILHKG
ncbi:MAG: putative toxin-antitoxin system toxin component, PIN family [Elusimicrobia bacterium HGW-Elusimicrobia-1]|jgi:putative PIN family toxin of toxin-antitoxin system|nr:MAG: putative toxin-antitoxin system toxin component, PIN family [Elusimicrobia bacterium HGW-Elusimicrobia-1]